MSEGLSVHVDFGAAGTVPGGEEGAALAALVLDILGAAH